MEKTSLKLGTKEFIAIIMLTVGTKLSDDTPSILYKSLGNAAWLGIIIMALLYIIPIFLLVKLLILYKDKNLVDITLHLFGKYIGVLVIFVLWAIQIYITVVNSSIYADVITTMYFTRTPNLIIYLVLMGVAVVGAQKGLQYIGSAAWIMLIMIKLSLLIVLVITFKEGESGFIFPILGPGVKELVTESISHSSILYDFIFFGLVASYLKSAKVYKTGIWFGFFFVIFEMVLALIGYLMIFDYRGIQMVDYPYHETIRFIQLGFLTNLESFFFPFWLVAAFIRFCYYLYLSALLFGALFKIQSFEYTVIPLAVVIVFLGMIAETPVFMISEIKNNAHNFITPIAMFLPCLLWLTAKIKGDFKQ